LAIESAAAYAAQVYFFGRKKTARVHQTMVIYNKKCRKKEITTKKTW
jgi:hypothetical protein